MTDSLPTPDTLLQLCASASPGAWFPSQYAQAAGIDRDALDEPLNQLRIAGLVKIGGWEPGRGQCYVLTEAGREALANPRTVSRALNGSPKPAAPPPRPGRLTAWDRGEVVRAAFVPGGFRPPVVTALIVLQVLAFAAGAALVAHRHESLSGYVAKGVTVNAAGIPHSPLQRLVLTIAGLQIGQWWRLVTYAVVHYGALHLLMNLYGHVALGGLVERMFGSVRFLVLYLLSALGGGVAAALLAPVGAATAGSSGALCGLIGGFAAFVFLNRRHLGNELFDYCRRWLGNTLVLLILFSMMPDVSWQGHLGGAVAGLVAGVLLTYHRFGTAEQRWAALLGLVLLPIAGIAPLVEKGILRWSPPPASTTPAEAERPPVVDEWENFLKLVGKPTETARELFIKQRDNFIDDLRYQSPARRDPNRVAGAHMLLALSRKNLQAARVFAEQAGPYQKPLYEPARRAALDYTKAAEAVVNAMDQCFNRGDKWQISADPNDPKATDELRLQQLFNELLEKDLVWSKLGAKVIITYDPKYVPPSKTAPTASGGTPVLKPNAPAGQAR
jgi:membrane associated rhomboid family serine protease